MQILVVVLLSITSLSTVSVSVADQQPEEILETLFHYQSPEEIRAISAGELRQQVDKGIFDTYRFPNDIKISYREMQSSDTQLSFTIDAATSNGGGNFYAFLEQHDKEWKAVAVRSLAVGLLHELANTDLETISLEPELLWSIENAKFVVQQDQKLKNYLIKNLDTFEDVRRKCVQGDCKQAKATLRKHFIHHVDLSNGLLTITIGGILDNSVGYFWSATPENIPTPSKNRYIYVEHIKNGWHIFKTT